jgi:glycosyltransferase involved in cell wall biosynthesis
LGGAQLYVLRRAKYLAKKGIKVSVIVSHHNADNFILEKQFSKISFLNIPQLGKIFGLTPKNRLADLIFQIKKFLPGFDEGVVESHTLELGIWGEFIASHLNFNHVLYVLAEPLVKHYYFYPGYKFFLYKLNRGEFYGTNSRSLSIMFEKPVHLIQNYYVNVPFDEAELDEKSFPELKCDEIDLNSFVIGTLSRLEKGFVIPLIESCISLAGKHSDKKVTLIVAGGSENPALIFRLMKKYVGAAPTNLAIIFPGYIKILGRDIFKMLDVFVGQGTAAINAISQKCATLIVEPYTNKCAGIFGVETNNFGYSESGILYSIEEKLESLLNDSSLLSQSQAKGYELFQRQYSISSCFSILDGFIENSKNSVEYYSFSYNSMVRISENCRLIKSLINTTIFRMIQRISNKKKSKLVL